MPKLLQPSFQEECAEVREGKDPVGKAYISGRELDTALDVGVLFTADQSRKGLGTIVSCLDLYGENLLYWLCIPLTRNLS